MTKLELIEKINDILIRKKTCIIAIDGMSASGKTTLGNWLHEQFPHSCLFHMDDFFLQPHQRTPDRLTEIGGNVDYERFYQEVLCNILAKQDVKYRPFYCATQSLGPELEIPFASLAIIEGAYSQHPYFGDIYDLRIFCEISNTEQKERILKRNGLEKWKRFESEWIPKERAYVEHFHIKSKSELLLK